MLWIWNPEPKKGGRGRAQVNSRFGEFFYFCVQDLKLWNQSECSEIPIQQVWTLNLINSENVSRMLIPSGLSFIFKVNKCWTLPFIFSLVKKCWFFPFIVLKSTNSDSPFIFPKHTEYTPVPRMVENGNNLSQTLEFMVILPRLKPVVVVTNQSPSFV